MIYISAREKIEEILKSKLEETMLDDIDIPLRVYDGLESLQKEKKYGTSISLGYDGRMKKNINAMHRDIFKGNNFNVMDEDFFERLSNAAVIDGAVLINKKGQLLNSGIIYRGDPLVPLERMRKNIDEPWMGYGFNFYVGTRHLASISASYYMPKTLIFVLSEEQNTIRIFHRGKIIYSPLDNEIANS